MQYNFKFSSGAARGLFHGLVFVSKYLIFANITVFLKFVNVYHCQGFLNFFWSAESCYIHKIRADGCYTFFKVATLLHFLKTVATLLLWMLLQMLLYKNVAMNIVKNVATNIARNVATANAMDDVISNFCSNFFRKNFCSNFLKNVATIFRADIKILNAERCRHAGRFKNPCIKMFPINIQISWKMFSNFCQDKFLKHDIYIPTVY